MKTDTYFQNFLDAQNQPRFYKLNSAPEQDGVFITADIHQRRKFTGWTNFSGIFAIYGKPKDWEEMYEVADELQRLFQELSLINLGDFVISEGEDPVQERVVLSVSSSFGV